MLDDFMNRAALAGLGVAIASAPLGCFVVWRRMAYFGEATAHAAMLGVALSLVLEQSIFLGPLFIALIMAWTITQLSGRVYAYDTLLGVFAHSALAVGLVVVSFVTGVRIDLMAYLFGDILAVSIDDLEVIWSGMAIISVLILWRWRPLLLATMNEELAYASGYNPRREQLILTVSLAITVAVSIKVVGILLIASMLIIPAAAARNIARTPESMVVITLFVSSLAVLIGLRASYILDTPTAASMVCVAALIFVIFNIIGTFSQNN